MHYDMLLLRFGEFTLKGKNRARFEKAVLKHVKLLLKPFPGASLRKEFGRIYVVLGESLMNRSFKYCKRCLASRRLVLSKWLLLSWMLSLRRL